jgi:hypothetical protein
MRIFDWRAFLGSVVLVSIGTVGLHAVSGMPYWGCFLIVLFALVINGWVATREDEQPGGFNNPKDRPPQH